MFESLVESRRIDIHNVHNGAGGSQQNICLDRADVTGLGDVIVPLHNNNVSCCDLQCQWRHFLTHRTPSACRPPPPPPPACASALCSQLPASWTRPALNTREGQPLLHHTYIMTLSDSVLATTLFECHENIQSHLKAKGDLLQVSPISPQSLVCRYVIVCHDLI